MATVNQYPQLTFNIHLAIHTWSTLDQQLLILCNAWSTEKKNKKQKTKKNKSKKLEQLLADSQVKSWLTQMHQSQISWLSTDCHLRCWWSANQVLTECWLRVEKSGAKLEYFFPCVIIIILLNLTCCNANGQLNFLFSVKGLFGLVDMSLLTTDACLMRKRALERILCRH